MRFLFFLYASTVFALCGHIVACYDRVCVWPCTTTGSGTEAPLILNLSSSRLLVIICTPHSLYNGQRTPLSTGTGGRLDPTANMHVLEKTKISCHCQESNRIPSTQRPSHYTDWAIPIPRCWETLQLLEWKTLFFTQLTYPEFQNNL